MENGLITEHNTLPRMLLHAIQLTEFQASVHVIPMQLLSKLYLVGRERVLLADAESGCRADTRMLGQFS